MNYKIAISLIAITAFALPLFAKPKKASLKKTSLLEIVLSEKVKEEKRLEAFMKLVVREEDRNLKDRRILEIGKTLLVPEPNTKINLSGKLAHGILEEIIKLDTPEAAKFVLGLSNTKVGEMNEKGEEKREPGSISADLKGHAVTGVGTLSKHLTVDDLVSLAKNMGEEEFDNATTLIRTLIEGKAQGKFDASQREKLKESKNQIAKYFEMMHWVSPDRNPKKMAEGAFRIVGTHALGNKQAAMSAFELFRESLEESEQKAFDSAIQDLKRGNYSAAADKGDPCKTVCALVERREEWRNKGTTAPEEVEEGEIQDMTGLSVALRTLSGLFITRAAPFCASAKERLENLKKNWFKNFPDCKKTEKGPALDRKLAPLRERSGVFSQPGFATEAFAEQYYSLVLRELLKDASLKRNCRKQIEESLRGSEAGVAFQLKVLKDAEEDLNGKDSNMMTYAMASAVISSKEVSPTILEKMKRILKEAGTPTRIPYYPKPGKEETDRSAAARSVPFLFALYFKTADGPEKEALRVDLLATLRNYILHLPSLLAHVQRDGTHLGKDALAPYYYYSTVPFATSALKFLLNRTKDPKEQEELSQMQKTLRGSVFSMLGADGLVTPEGEPKSKQYRTAPAYNNPLAGLALIAASQCSPTKSSLDFGIVDPSLEAQGGTPRSDTNPTNSTGSGH